MIYSRSPGWQSPQEQKNVSPAPYPWRKLYSCKNKTFLGPTFPFPWSSGLSSLAALGRQLSCRSRKVKSCPSESLVLTWIHSFRGKVRGIYILLHLTEFVIYISRFAQKHVQWQKSSHQWMVSEFWKFNFWTEFRIFNNFQFLLIF